MNSPDFTNKQGQSLGPKGYATRQRLLEAAERLLKVHSPLSLTAVAIAKEAKTSSATFYMYFNDVKDLFFYLSCEASDQVVSAIESLSDFSSEDPESIAKELVRVFYDVWNRHRHILLYRNLEADRGDEFFEKNRTSAYTREVQVISELIRSVSKDPNLPTVGDAFALASVLHAALERLASVDPAVVVRGLGMKRFYAAQVRVIAQVLVDSSKWGRLSLESIS